MVNVLAWSGPSSAPPAPGDGVVQIDPAAPYPSLVIDGSGNITTGVWEPLNPSGIIGTLYGGTGCSETTPAGVRSTSCLSAAVSGANDDITSLEPTGSSDLLILPTSTGNLGIGTGAVILTAKLSVGTGAAFRVDSSGDLIRVNDVLYSWPLANAPGALTNDGLGGLSWGVGGGGGGSPGGWTEDPAVPPGGVIYTTTITRNVGIGTTTPTEKLHVVGDVNLTGDNYITAKDTFIPARPTTVSLPGRWPVQQQSRAGIIPGLATARLLLLPPEKTTLLSAQTLCLAT